MSSLPPELAIRVTGLSKKYRLFDSPRQRLKEALDPRGRTFHKDFWALQDVAFEVPKGQTVGIIGRNGSGKSTLLQILTGVMQPTAGTVEVAGRVVALLELGAGFDPDFTGRENARQYGRMQGLSAAQAEARLPEIEAFANIGEFFDREVRRYSSGMFARLAFAAAINVDPDVLILDEILAVGDARFQQRCYAKVNEMRSRGTTIFIVTHAWDVLPKICGQAILLEAGRMVASGDPRIVVNKYHDLLFGGKQSTEQATMQVLGSSSTGGAEPDDPRAGDFILSPCVRNAYESRRSYNPNESRLGDRRAEVTDYLILSPSRADPVQFTAGERMDLYIKVFFVEEVHRPNIGFGITTTEGIVVFGSNTFMAHRETSTGLPGATHVYRFSLPLALASGDYFINLGIGEVVDGINCLVDARRAVAHLQVSPTPWCDGLLGLTADFAECAIASLE